MKKQSTVKKKSFREVFKDTEPVEFDDTLEKRLDFVESIVREGGDLVENAPIHVEMQKNVFRWERKHENGLIRVPYGVGKSTQITQVLNLYHLTLDPNHLIIILSSKPSAATSRVTWIRNMIENSKDYKRWCKDTGLKPLELSDMDTGSSRFIYVKRGSTSPHPSVSGYGVNEGGTGWRATIITPDDIVDRKNSQYTKDRERVWQNWVNTWSKRLKPSGMVYGVFTPYHPKDANMKMIGTGNFCELKIRVAKDKQHYEMFSNRPVLDGDENYMELVEKNTELPLWIEQGHDSEYYQKKENEDMTAYQRGYEMREDVEEEGDLCYPHYSDDYWKGKDMKGGELGGNVVDGFSLEPTGYTPFLVVDFNYNPQCWSIVQKQGNKHIILHELRVENATTQRMAGVMADKLKRLGIPRVNIVGEAMTKNSRAEFDDYDEIRDVFSAQNIKYSIKTGKSNPSVRGSVTLINTGLADTHGRRSLLVHERCKHVRRDFRKVQRGEDGKPLGKDSELTHFSDGLRYYWWYQQKGRNQRTLPNLR